MQSRAVCSFSGAHGTQGVPWLLLLSLPSGPGAGAWRRISHTRDAAGAVHEHCPLLRVGLTLNGRSRMGVLCVSNMFSWELKQWVPYVSYKKHVWKIT